MLSQPIVLIVLSNTYIAIIVIIVTIFIDMAHFHCPHHQTMTMTIKRSINQISIDGSPIEYNLKCIISGNQLHDL